MNLNHPNSTKRWDFLDLVSRIWRRLYLQPQTQRNRWVENIRNLLHTGVTSWKWRKFNKERMCVCLCKGGSNWWRTYRRLRWNVGRNRGLTMALVVCVFVCIFLRGKIDTVKSDLFAADGRNRSTAGKPECLSGRISARLGRTWENRL